MGSTSTKALGILADRRRSNELRAACAVLIGKFGSPASRTVLRNQWDLEDSDHVRAAMLLAVMFYGREERNILLTLWGNQSPLFALVANAVRKQLGGAV